MKTRLAILLSLWILGSCGSKSPPKEAPPAPPQRLSNLLDQAPEGVFGLISFKSFEAAEDFEKAMGDVLPDNKLLSNFLKSIPGFEKEQGANKGAPIHIVVSVSGERPLFELLLPVARLDQFEEATSAQREGPLQGNDFFFVDQHDRLFGNSLGSFVFLSESPTAFHDKRDFLNLLLEAAPPAVTIQILLAQEKLLTHFPDAASRLRFSTQSASQPSELMRSKVSETYQELGVFFSAMKVVQYSLDIKSERLTVEINASWVEESALHKDFAKAPCDLHQMAANLPPQSYLIMAHCIPSMYEQLRGFQARLKEAAIAGEPKPELRQAFHSVTESIQSNFRAEASALYGRGSFPFSMLSLTLVEKADVALKNMLFFAQRIIDAVNSESGGAGHIKDLNQLLTMAQMLVQPTGIKMKVDKELPVVGVQLEVEETSKSRMPPSVAQMMELLMTEGIDLALGFEGSWSGQSLGPGAIGELEQAMRKADIKKPKSKLRPGVPSMRYVLWMDLVEGFKRMGPILSVMAPQDQNALKLLRAMVETPSDAGIQLSFGGQSESIHGLLEIPLAAAKFLNRTFAGNN
jgi:hypothetical protein